MSELKETEREMIPGELPCTDPLCDGVMVVEPNNSYQFTCEKCGKIK